MSPPSLSESASEPTTKPMLRAIASKPLPTVNVADVAMTGVLVKRFARKTSETDSGAKCRVENVGSYQSTWVLPIFNNLPHVVLISLTAPFTRARSATASESIISSSALIICTIAAAASLTLRIGDSSDEGISSKRPCALMSPRI